MDVLDAIVYMTRLGLLVPLQELRLELDTNELKVIVSNFPLELIFSVDVG